MFKLENWSTVSVDNETNRYTPPEAKSVYLNGEIYGNPRFTDGNRITTTRIVKIDGNLVETYSGSKYELGEPDPKFVEYCKNNNLYVPTKEVPIKVH